MEVVWRIPFIRGYGTVVLRMIYTGQSVGPSRKKTTLHAADGSMLYGKLFCRCQVIVSFAIPLQNNMSLGASRSLQ
jgi:hypothetical protein